MVKKYLWLLGFVATGLTGFEQRAARNPIKEQHSVPAGEIGSRLPDFVLKDLQGRSLSSVELRGKVVLIDFWATWCEPCKKEMPGYQMLLDRYGPHGLVVLGLKFNIMKDTEDPAR